MHFSFEGNYKQKRNINLGGVRSREDKKTLLAKAHAERKAREKERLMTQCANKIQAFCIGRQIAARCRRDLRTTLMRDLDLNLDGSLTLTQQSTVVAHWIQTLLLISNSRGTHNQDDVLTIRLCTLLLESNADGEPLIMRILNCQTGKDLDEWVWRTILLTNKVLLPALCRCTSNEALESAQLPLAVIDALTDPRHYTVHSTYIRILTYTLLRGNLLQALRVPLSRVLSPEHSAFQTITQIIVHTTEAKPPFDYPPSYTLLAQSQLVQYPTPGLFNNTTNKTNVATSPLYLSQQAIAYRFIVDILSIPFIIDHMSNTMVNRILASLSFQTILEQTDLLINKNDVPLSEQDLAGLLLNITEIGNLGSGTHLGNALIQYAKTVQSLVSKLPTAYFAEEATEFAQNPESSDEDSDTGSDKDGMLVDSAPTQYTNPRIKEQLETLYDATKIQTLVYQCMKVASASPKKYDTAWIQMIGTMANLLNNLMICWPTKKSVILNALVHYGYQYGTNVLPQLLWQAWLNHDYAAVFGDDQHITERLGEAQETLTKHTDPQYIWSILYLLCETSIRLMMTFGDDEFFNATASDIPLTKSDMVDLSRHLKSISFLLFWRANAIDLSQEIGQTGIRISQLRSVVTKLLQHIHSRDARRSFCPKDHWLVRGIETEGFSKNVMAEELALDTEGMSNRQPSKRKLASISPRLGLLNNIPFVIPFEKRVEIFRMFVENDPKRAPYSGAFPVAKATIHRDHVLEDGFSQLYQLGAQLKQRISISFVDEFGLEEAGIDGGGVFKEFLTCLSREAFDPKSGLFLCTPDNFLYPNVIDVQSLPKQLAYIEFLGLIMGKALYDGILLDVGFAEFFLKKALGGVNYLDDLPSLDPDLYRGLIAVKNFRGNVQELSLDFTLSVEGPNGKKRTVELVPGGGDIPVTNENRIQYVYLVANYRLNSQIARQCKAFFKGLSTILDIKWLRMFNQQELQVLFGGVSAPIDLEDLRNHTVYNGCTSQDDTIQYLWRALESFDNTQRMKFVKFVTSCSRPPLLGFKELHPRLCVQMVGVDNNRLPTSSTCINLLKLPRFSSFKILREKLLYAINAEAGFDLS